ncbi:MAG TPA: acyltransferase [Solirubrobacteraceae bacterium]
MSQAAPAQAAPRGDAPAAAPAAGPRGVLDHDAYRAQRYFPALDGVRAVAVMLVFTVHVKYEDFWKHFAGGNGVTMFFVLSGFLITTLALREEGRRGALSLRSFYIRRLFRIYPTYFGVLALYCVLIYGAGFVPERRGLFSDQLPYYVLGFPEHGYFGLKGIESGPPFAAAWSIGIEEKFYLVWPLLGFVFLRGRFRARIAACVIAAVCCVTAPSLWDGGVYLREYVFIVIGVMLALALHERRWYDRLRLLASRGVVLATFAALAALQVAGVLDEQPVRVLDGILVAVALAGIVMSARSDTAWLRARPMVFLGQVSYVFYLTHNFALNFVEKTPLGKQTLLWSFADVIVAFPLAVLIAWAIHASFERPLTRVGHRLAHRDKPFHAV